MPVGAVITRPKIMDGVFNSMERCVVHSNTFGQNDMAMAAALASLHVIEEDKLVENAAAMGEYVMDRLEPIGADLPVRLGRSRQGADVRHRLRPARESSLKLKMAWDMLHKMNFGVFGQMIIIPLLQKHRILTQVAGYHTEVIKFLPPMTMTKEDIDWFLTAMEDVLADTEALPRRRVGHGVGPGQAAGQGVAAATEAQGKPETLKGGNPKPETRMTKNEEAPMRTGVMFRLTRSDSVVRISPLSHPCSLVFICANLSVVKISGRPRGRRPASFAEGGAGGRHLPRWTLALSLRRRLLGCVLYAVLRLNISTDQDKLFSSDVPFFRDYLDFEASSPKSEAMYVVIEPKDHGHGRRRWGNGRRSPTPSPTGCGDA